MNLVQKKPDEAKKVEDQEAPINLSNLETNKLEEFGRDEIEFTQNSVPFDFDGNYLLWMDYKAKGVREIHLYDFNNKKKETILTFGQKDGIISHCKLTGEK